MHKHLRLGISFFIGETCGSMAELKKQLQYLYGVKKQRFYAGERTIANARNVETTTNDLFAYYAEALQDVRNCILAHKSETTAATVAKWAARIETDKYSIEVVRSWVLNLATELELKYTVMQSFVTNFNAEQLHRTIYSMDTLDHLKHRRIARAEASRAGPAMTSRPPRPVGSPSRHPPPGRSSDSREGVMLHEQRLVASNDRIRFLML